MLLTQSLTRTCGGAPRTHAPNKRISISMSHIKQSGIFYFSYVTLNFHLREIEQVGKDFFLRFILHLTPFLFALILLLPRNSRPYIFHVVLASQVTQYRTKTRVSFFYCC